MGLPPHNLTSSCLTFQKSLFTDITWSQPFLCKNLTMSQWHDMPQHLVRVSHNQLWILNPCWRHHEECLQLPHFPFLKNEFFPALPVLINYPLDEKCVDLLDYVNFWFKLNKHLIKLTNFLQSMIVDNAISFNLVLEW